jgi:hypothetical protein
MCYTFWVNKSKVLTPLGYKQKYNSKRDIQVTTSWKAESGFHGKPAIINLSTHY